MRNSPSGRFAFFIYINHSFRTLPEVPCEGTETDSAAQPFARAGRLREIRGYRRHRVFPGRGCRVLSCLRVPAENSGKSPRTKDVPDLDPVVVQGENQKSNHLIINS